MGSPVGVGTHHLAAFDSSIRPLVESGQIRGVADDDDIGHGLSFWPAPGHTPGHCAIAVTSYDRSAMIAGDIFHCPAQVAEPGWSHRADMDIEMAQVSRRHFIDEAARAGWHIAAGHFRDGCNFGHIERVGGTARWVSSHGTD
jgi:glyoxylase-like metal-dependent hydrolase (beta-lactamase superfamily II)